VVHAKLGLQATVHAGTVDVTIRSNGTASAREYPDPEGVMPCDRSGSPSIIFMPI
jgi:hypothetical protein